MHCTLILWNLSQSGQTVQSLRDYLRDYAVDAYARVDGLRQKIWVSSTGPDGEMWGAVYLWDDERLAYGRPPGVSRVVELIGYAPTQRAYFSVEAAVTGPGVTGLLGAGLGLAFEDPGAPPMTRPQEFVPAGVAGQLIRAPRSAPGQPGEHRDGVQPEHLVPAPRSAPGQPGEHRDGVQPEHLVPAPRSAPGQLGEHRDGVQPEQ